MTRLSLFLCTIFFCVFSLLFLPVTAHAEENFSTSYSVVYAIKDEKTTEAKLDVELTNNTSEYFASSYTLQVGFDDIKNITASDLGGQLEPKVTKNEAGNAISLKFNKKIVGIHNKQKFTLTFDTPNVARKQGNVWEINVPGIANPDEFSDFTVTIVPPDGIGEPTYIKPATHDHSLTFTKADLGKAGISVAFGDSQIYSFDLQYHLRNENVFPVQTEIALPPTTNYQDIAIDSISPRPDDVILDDDGNWLAQYRLSPSEKTDVVVTGRAKMHLVPQKEALSDDDRKKYLQAQQYWEVTNPKIQELAKKLKTPEAIYSYVVNTLKYDFTRVSDTQERLGAVKALANPKQAVCLEFTDLFIALSRAAGIPARELNGFAYTENAKQRPLSLVQDILHAWPEYYDDTKGAWVMVDPTWGNTTGGIDYFHIFDFDHLVFVTKGEDSRYPIPAGGYKFEEDKEKKDVHVGFADSFITTPAQIVLEPQLHSIYASALPIRGTISVMNTGHTLADKQVIDLTSQELLPHTQKIHIPLVPPYGRKDVAFAFDSVPFLTNKTYKFTIEASGQTTYHTIRVTPFVLTKPRILGGIALVISSIIIWIIAYESRRIHVLRRRKHRSVRR